MMYVCDIHRDYKATSLRFKYQRGCVMCMVLRNKKMASNIQLTMGRDREIVDLMLLFR